MSALDTILASMVFHAGEAGDLWMPCENAMVLTCGGLQEPRADSLSLIQGQVARALPPSGQGAEGRLIARIRKDHMHPLTGSGRRRLGGFDLHGWPAANEIFAVEVILASLAAGFGRVGNRMPALA
jgi:hypothetical protein